MNRIEALNEVKENIEKLMESLQKTDPGDAINIADPYWDTECFESLVNSADEALSWIGNEIKQKMLDEVFQENEALPDEGPRTGALVGE